MTIDETEALNHAKVREFDGDPAATDSTRVLRLPGFANKKYESDFYVLARTESTQTPHLRDFKLQIYSQDAPRHQHEELSPKNSAQSRALSQSEHDWAFAKRSLARGDEKHANYARHTVEKAQRQLKGVSSLQPSRGTLSSFADEADRQQ